MASVKWIKITTDIFDDEKIILIESLPESYAIITVWFKLLCLAGKQNNCGVFMIGRIPYTDKMLATIFRMKEATVTLALQTFQQFGMIEIVDGVITIPNWDKHQSLDKLEVAKEQTRQRVARHREKQKQLLAESNGECNVTRNVTVTECNADRNRIRNIDIDINIEKEKDKKEKENVTHESQGDSATPQEIIDLYNSICISFPSVRTLSDARKKTIKARLKTFTLDDFKELFEKAESSSFLKGNNPRKWKATFDWLIKDANMAKVLDGNYDNQKDSNSSFDVDDFFNAAVNRSYGGRAKLERGAAERMESKEEPKTAADDPELLERLKKIVGGYN